MAVASKVPETRIRVLWDHAPAAQGRFVLYWMTATRRAGWNYALDRSIELARELRRPLVVLEALRVDYPWASARIHRFVLQGMAANRKAFEGTDVLYHPYVEPTREAGKGLLAALSSSACAVVSDDFPCFFLPRMLASARLDVGVRFEAVDSNGLLPIRAGERAYSRAVDFRRFLQRELGGHLSSPPRPNPLARLALPRLAGLPAAVSKRWPRAPAELLEGKPAALAALPIDHEVKAVELEGGATAGDRVLGRFLARGVDGYGEGRNRIDGGTTSGLSPYLHFGHVAPHQILAKLATREDWSPAGLGPTANGKREGWWGMSAPAESFLDQLVTWRELGLNACVNDPRYARYESLPAWSRASLEKHAGDERPLVYALADFEHSRTHDALWNAAQSQLRGEGTIHGYLRMLWGKKILHWSASPREALEIMVELNDKYALDGRDPNSYSGILWTLGKFDRPWGPERPIFGNVRYMTSENTRRKMRVDEYVQRWSGSAERASLDYS